MPAGRHTSFVGRESEISRVVDLLHTTRLLMLVGPGGVGKTRLAAELTRKLVDSAEPADTCFVELADASLAEVVPQTIAEALGIREQHGRSATATLIAELAGRSVFLVIDMHEYQGEPWGGRGVLKPHRRDFLRILGSSLGVALRRWPLCD
jgi:ATP/maltotriose-dependent transcriptional regulator MalT